MGHDAATPMMQQYWQIRRTITDPNTILFYRLGDFYEMFFDDATTAAPLLDIALTTRNRNDPNPIPLCGVPYHSAEGYIAKLLAHGKKVAICEQVEDPKTAKGVVRREIVRSITPGAVLAPEALPARASNYLAAIHGEEGRYGLAQLDLSTGEFCATQLQTSRALAEELAKPEVREVLFPKPWVAAGLPLLLKTVLQEKAQTPADSAIFDPQCLPALDGLPTISTETPAALSAIAAIWNYVARMSRSAVVLTGHIRRVQLYRTTDYLALDEVAKRNLELFRPMGEGDGQSGTLLHLLDQTVTPMGARRLKTWMAMPLRDRAAIDERLDAVQHLVEDFACRLRCQEALRGVRDIERLTTRIVTEDASPRDCIALRDSLVALVPLRSALANVQGLLEVTRDRIDPCTDLQDEIARTLVDDPPLAITDGGVIRPGVAAELDELRAIQQEGKGFIARLEATERQRTGIGSLKIRYNKVFGYYIEITHTHREKVPADYIRKQTLTNAERYITPELKSYEEKVLHAAERIHAIEYELFCRHREQLGRAAARLQETARAVATIDVLVALAAVAQAQRYCRPTLVDEPVLHIAEGRHPVIETLPAERFIPNNCDLDARDRRMMVITGPNMAGKSTVMRQTALIVVMAQMGGFVPARQATIGLADRIFTRVGASDNLTRGQSTFMVEMAEAATILHEATPRSLIVIDEIGRGTSTYDGVAIAWSVAEYLHDRVGARTLFATHYHELADLALTKSGVANFTMAVKEWKDQIVFLRKLVPGAVNRSYGIHVAQLAGLPASVITRAKEVLANLEQGELNESGQPVIAKRSKAAPTPSTTQLALFVPPESSHDTGVP